MLFRAAAIPQFSVLTTPNRNVAVAEPATNQVNPPGKRFEAPCCYVLTRVPDNKLATSVSCECVCVRRASFTWWVTIVQVICFIVTMSVYGFATIGGFTTTIRGEVLLDLLLLFYAGKYIPERLKN